MTISFKCLRVLPLLAAVFLPACTTVEETGRKRLSLVGENNLQATAATQFSQIKNRRGLPQSHPQSKRVDAIGRRIARVSSKPGINWEFVAIDDKVPNAFAMPGGKVGVHTGLMPIAANDDGLAAIIGHEIAHVTLEHSSERASQQLLSNVALISANVGLSVAGVSGAGDITKALGVGANIGLLSPYSRVHEREADRLGLIYMARAGYDPRKAPDVWRRMAAWAEKNNKSSEFANAAGALTRTHPWNRERIEVLEKAMPEALEAYKNRKR